MSTVTPPGVESSLAHLGSLPCQLHPDPNPACLHSPQPEPSAPAAIPGSGPIQLTTANLCLSDVETHQQQSSKLQWWLPPPRSPRGCDAHVWPTVSTLPVFHFIIGKEFVKTILKINLIPPAHLYQGSPTAPSEVPALLQPKSQNPPQPITHPNCEKGLVQTQPQKCSPKS